MPPSESAPDNPLNPVIRRLVESKAARLYGDRPIGDFWSPTDPRSPFEEALTIRQLCGLNLDPFIQKRSFTEAKLHALIRAIEACVVRGDNPQTGEDGGDVASQVSVARSIDGPLSGDGKPGVSHQQRIWPFVEATHPLVTATLSSLFASSDSDGSILARIAHRAVQSVPVEGLEVLACCQYLTELETAKLLGRERHHTKQIRDHAIRCAREALHIDPILSLPVMLLRGAVLVSPDLLVTQLRDSSPMEPGAARFSVAILCSAASLVSVAAGGLGRWLMTADNARVEESFEAIRSRLPRDNEEILSWVEGMFPLVSREQCEAILRVVGSYDEKTELWFSRSERPKVKSTARQASSSGKRRGKKGSGDRDLN